MPQASAVSSTARRQSRTSSSQRPKSDRPNNQLALDPLPSSLDWEQVTHEAGLDELVAVALNHKASGYPLDHMLSEHLDSEREPLRAAWRQMERLIRSGRIKEIVADLLQAEAEAKENPPIPQAIAVFRTQRKEPEFVGSSRSAGPTAVLDEPAPAPAAAERIRPLVIRMTYGYHTRAIEELMCCSGEDIRQAAERACSAFAHGPLCRSRGEKAVIKYEVFQGSTIERMMDLLEKIEKMSVPLGLKVEVRQWEATIAEAGEFTVRFDPTWLLSNGGAAEHIREHLDEPEPEFNVTLAELDLLPYPKEFLSGDASPLLNAEHYDALVNGFRWWIYAADILIPVQYSLDDEMVREEGEESGCVTKRYRPLRDRLIALEAAFWGDLAAARRYAVWASSIDEMIYQGIPATLKLLEHYLLYRKAVCELAVGIISPSLRVRLEERL